MYYLASLNTQSLMTILERLKHIRIFRSLIYGLVGIFTYPGLALFNTVEIEGTENLKNLPHKNVLFVSNHQTYFGDVIAFVHIFCAVKWGSLTSWVFLLFIEPFYQCIFCSCRRNYE